MARPQSAGTLIYRQGSGALEVLIVHASGRYNRRAPWGIPKGLVDDGEDLETTARRETEEETGVEIVGPMIALGSIDYTRSRKTIHCFAAPLPEGAEPRVASWEIDAAEMFEVERARELIHPDQAAFIDRLIEALESD